MPLTSCSPRVLESTHLKPRCKPDYTWVNLSCLSSLELNRLALKPPDDGGLKRRLHDAINSDLFPSVERQSPTKPMVVPIHQVFGRFRSGRSGGFPELPEVPEWSECLAAFLSKVHSSESRFSRSESTSTTLRVISWLSKAVLQKIIFIAQHCITVAVTKM